MTVGHRLRSEQEYRDSLRDGRRVFYRGDRLRMSARIR
jgi:aromatic ring hydroxylase